MRNVKIDPTDEARQTRAAAYAGGALAVVPYLFFVWPFGAWPLQSLILIECLLAACGASLLIRLVREREPLLRSVGRVGVMAAGLFALWTWLRWRTMHPPDPFQGAEPLRITAQGRTGVVAAQMIPVGIVLALGLRRLIGSRRDTAAAAMSISMTLLLAGFSALAIYQRLFGYEHQLATLGEEVKSAQGISDDLARGIIHALGTGRVGGRLGNGNVFAASLAVPGLFAVRTFARNGGAWRMLAAASLAAGTVAVFFTGSRGGLLTWIAAIATGAAIAGIRIPKRPAMNAKGAAIAGLLFMAIVASRSPAGADPSPATEPQTAPAAERTERAGFFGRLGNTATIRERLYYWSVARDVWRLSPVTGSGPGSFQLLYSRFQVSGSRESRHAHSWFFQITAEAGLIGLGMFLAIIAATAVGAFRDAREQEPPRSAAASLSVWCAAGCGLLLFNGLFEYSMQLREFLLLFGVLCGLALGADARPAETPKPARHGVTPRPPLSLRGVASCGLLLFSAGIAARESASLCLGEFHEWEARFASQAGEFEAAESEYLAASRYQPDHEGYLTARAMLIARDPARFADAADLVRRAREMNPLSAGIRMSEAWLQEAAGRSDLARESLNAAVILRPNDAGVRISRAQLLMRLGEIEEAKQDLALIESRELPLWQESVGGRPSQQETFDSLRALIRSAEEAAR